VIQPAAHTRASVDATTCIACGYDLSGLPKNGVCRGCGAAAAESRRPDSLIYAPRTYITRVADGAKLINYGLTAFLITIIVLGALIFMIFAGLSAWAPSGGSGVPLLNARLVVALVGAAAVWTCLGVVFWGWIRFTAQKPACAYACEPAPGRRVTRVSLIVLIAAELGGFTLAQLWSATASPPVWWVPMLVDNLITSLAFGFHAWAAMCYTTWVAHRLPPWELTEKLRDQVRRNRYACPLWATVGFVLCGLGPLIAFMLYYNTFITARKVFRDLSQTIADDANDESTVEAMPAM